MIENNIGTLDSRHIAEMAWAAGFADGEACIYIYRQKYLEPKRKPLFRLGFAISQNDRITLEHFKNILNIPCRIHLVKRQPCHSKQAYTLNMTGIAAINALTQLQPFLVRKKREAALAFSFWRFCQERKALGRDTEYPDEMEIRERYFSEMKRLK